MPKLKKDAVLSHFSAAAMNELSLPDTAPTTVHVSRDGLGGGGRSRFVHSHAAPLRPEEVVDISGVAVTSIARTLLDCACLLSTEAALWMTDDALRRGLVTLEELSAQLVSTGQRHGIRRVREVFELADAGSESAGESFSRLIFHRAGLPMPTLQLIVRDGEILIGRCDFGWKASRIIGEFDGKVKYGRILEPGQDAGEVVWREKLREDALRRLGWIVIRWTWSDLLHPERLIARLREAFQMASRRG